MKYHKGQNGADGQQQCAEDGGDDERDLKVRQPVAICGQAGHIDQIPTQQKKGACHVDLFSGKKDKREDKWNNEYNEGELQGNGAGRGEVFAKAKVDVRYGQYTQQSDGGKQEAQGAFTVHNGGIGGTRNEPTFPDAEDGLGQYVHRDISFTTFIVLQHINYIMATRLGGIWEGYHSSMDSSQSGQKTPKPPLQPTTRKLRSPYTGTSRVRVPKYDSAVFGEAICSHH